MSTHAQDPATDVNVVDTPLLGRSSNPRANPAYHVFGQISSDAVRISNGWNDPRIAAEGGAAWQFDERGPESRMRRIRSSGAGIVRVDGAGTLPPLAAVPSGPDKGVTSFHLLVRASTKEGATSFRMDIGSTIDLLCGRVDVQICGPNGHLVASDPDAELGGIVIDARIGCAVSCIESAAGDHKSVPFSEYIITAAAASTVVESPSHARELKVYMVDGVAGGNWTTYADDPSVTTVAPSGTIAFDATGTYSLDETKNVAGARYLETDATLARTALLVWTIEP